MKSNIIYEVTKKENLWRSC